MREASASGISTKLSPKKEAEEKREKGQAGKDTSCKPRLGGCCDYGASQAHQPFPCLPSDRLLEPKKTLGRVCFADFPRGILEGFGSEGTLKLI